MPHKGVELLKKYAAGGDLTRKESMLAKCADCMANYVDGRADCHVPTCPMYPYRPYQRDGGEEVPEESDAAQPPEAL